ncbi:hypothetical protein AVEN_45809-1 [Araneus ventricosus]|uniref:Uncharacterized protein n=1 Tax=Araneus ventricosus TaxID=182803 RepID=A0A4Y2FE82_ARAVE|nr:hypothetical protein AVEN_45809-1 [Araneus ventricosus]
MRSYLERETIQQMAWPVRSLNPIAACVGYVGKKNCMSQCDAMRPPRAPTSLTIGMGITATAINDTFAGMVAVVKHAFQLDHAFAFHTRY